MIAPRPVLCCVIAFSPAALLVWWPELQPALAPEAASRDPGLALSTQGWLHDQVGEWPAAIACYLQAVATYQTARDSRRIGHLFQRLGSLFMASQHWVASRHCIEMAVHHLRRSGDRPGLVTALRHLGLMHLRQGRQRLALKILEQALAECSQTNDAVSEALILANLGQVYGSQGKLLYGLACYDSALDLLLEQSPDLEIDSSLAWLRCLLGELCLQCGQPELALDHYHQAMALGSALGPAATAHILHQLGQLNEQLQRPTAALQCYQQALATCQNAGLQAHPVAIHADINIPIRHG